MVRLGPMAMAPAVTRGAVWRSQRKGHCPGRRSCGSYADARYLREGQSHEADIARTVANLEANANVAAVMDGKGKERIVIATFMERADYEIMGATISGFAVTPMTTLEEKWTSTGRSLALTSLRPSWPRRAWIPVAPSMRIPVNNPELRSSVAWPKEVAETLRIALPIMSVPFITEQFNVASTMTRIMTMRLTIAVYPAVEEIGFDERKRKETYDADLLGLAVKRDIAKHLLKDRAECLDYAGRIMVHNLPSSWKWTRRRPACSRGLMLLACWPGPARKRLAQLCIVVLWSLAQSSEHRRVRELLTATLIEIMADGMTEGGTMMWQLYAESLAVDRRGSQVNETTTYVRSAAEFAGESTRREMRAESPRSGHGAEHLEVNRAANPPYVYAGLQRCITFVAMWMPMRSAYSCMSGSSRRPSGPAMGRSALRKFVVKGVLGDAAA